MKESIIKNNSKSLLNKLFDNELHRFSTIEINFGKIQRLRTNHLNIETFMKNREENSVFIIQVEDQNTAVVIKAITEENDYINNYLLTISDSGETFKVDRILSSKTIYETIKCFNESKL